jgi:hypothetical protein
MERWWENFLIDEKKINLKHIQPEKSMEDLNQEEQMKIHQMMYDQRQKAMGLPTSEEQVKIFFKIYLFYLFFSYRNIKK